MKNIRNIIESIPIDAANLEHIAKTGKINGSLLISLEKAMLDLVRPYEEFLKTMDKNLPNEKI